MVIKALILPGGGPTGFVLYGNLKESNLHNIWNINLIEEIYSTSIGSIIAFMISLKCSWDILDDYIINRPWENIFNIPDFYDIYTKKGYDLVQVVKNITKPLLNALNLSESITLNELYQFNKINLSFISTEIKNDIYMNSEILNYKTYPNMDINIALASSCSIPIIFQPVPFSNKLFIDGGVFYNNPLIIALENIQVKEDEVLAFSNEYSRVREIDIDNINLFQYVYKLFCKTNASLNNIKDIPNIKNKIICFVEDNYDWLSILSDKSERKRLIENGKQSFIDSMTDSKIDLESLNPV